MTIPWVGVVRPHPIVLWGGTFAAYAGVSFLWGVGDRWWSAFLLLSLIASFAVGRLMSSTANLWFCVCLLLSASLTTLPWLTHGPFGNPNYLGCAMALGLAAALAYRLWFFLPLLAGGLWYSQSRGAILAGGVVCLIALWQRSRLLAICITAMFVSVVLIASEGRGLSILARLGIWQDTLSNFTVYGAGWGSFPEAYWTLPKHTNAIFGDTIFRPTHAYNDFIELMFELGWGMIPLWVVLFASMLGRAPDRLICWAFLVCSLTFFPLYLPPLGQMFALALGHNSRSSQWQDGD